MPHFNLSVRSGRKGFREGKFYDLDFAVLIHYSGVYRNRVEAFRRFGLVHTEGLKIHVTLLGSAGDGRYEEEICSGWPEGFDVTFLEMSSHLPVPKINGYYLWLKDHRPEARWYLRVDDDSITDAAATVRYMEERYGDSAVHLLTWPMEEEGSGAPFTTYIRQKGIQIPTFVHEYESSLTSRRALLEIFDTPDAVTFLEDTGRTISAPGDRSLTFAAHISKVPVGNNTVFTKDFLPTDMSILPRGRWAHVHYVPWGDMAFMGSLEAFLSKAGRPIETEHLEALVGSAANFGLCLNHVEAVLRLAADGSIAGGQSANERRWVFKDHELRILHEQGHAMTIFQRVVENNGQTWFFGPHLGDGASRFLHLSGVEIGEEPATLADRMPELNV